MTPTELLEDAFERIRDAVHPAVNGLSLEELTFRPGPEANSIGWLIWHLTRIQDDHVAHLAGVEHTWTAAGWAERFALPFEVGDTGYGHGPDDVPKVSAEAEALLGYFEDVHAATVDYVRQLSADDLRRVVDERFEPPVTVSIRLVSVIADDLQHVGQAAYVRGMLIQQ
jgi:uncharacterized damage-inducible protein DinB